MAFQHNIDSGSIFPNERKEKDTDRDYQGSGCVACPHCNNPFDIWISGWVNETKQNVEYLGLRFNAKEEQTRAGTVPVKGSLKRAPMAEPAPVSGVPTSDLDGDIPF